MFSIRQLFLFLSATYVLLLLISLLIARSLWFYPNELALQLERQQQELNSVNSVLTLLTQNLNTRATDYGLWLNALESDFAYLSADKVFQLLPQDVDAAIIFDTEKMPLMGIKQAGSFQKAQIEHSELKAQHQRLKAQYQSTFKDHASTDYVLLSDNLYLASIVPIHSQDSARIKGWVVLLKHLNDKLWPALESVSQLHITPVSLAQSSAPYINLSAPLSRPLAHYQRCLYNEAGAPLLCLHIRHTEGTSPAFLDQQGVAIFAFIILVPLVLFLIFLNILLKPLYRGIGLLQESGKNNILKPIDFQYWLPITEFKQFKETYNNIVHMALKQQQQLQLLSNTDKLTDIPNRRAFDQHFTHTWNRLKRRDLSMALVMIDIDFFKPYNDFYGHQQGDKALQLVAQALSSLARRTDEICARFGGEEFVLIVFIENEEELEQFKQRLNFVIEKLKIEHSQSNIGAHLTVSAGIAWLQNSGSWVENYLADDWLKAADKALYQAKSSGRNTQSTLMFNERNPFI